MSALGEPAPVQRFNWEGLPIELFIRIFEVAATEPTIASKLCLVSKVVCRWVTPVLYRTLVFDKPDGIHSYNSFYNSYKSRPSALETRNLIIKTGDTPSPSLNTKDCCHLRTINMMGTEYPAWHEGLPISPMLTHANIRGWYLSEAFSRPWFQTVTHLYCEDSIPASIAQAQSTFTPDNLPSLTHFVCNLDMSGNFAWTQFTFRDFLKHLQLFTQLHVAAVYVHQKEDKFSEPRETVYSSLIEMSHKKNHENTLIPVHPKLIIRPLKGKIHSFDDWRDWLGGGRSIWDQAEHDLLVQE